MSFWQNEDRGYKHLKTLLIKDPLRKDRYSYFRQKLKVIKAIEFRLGLSLDIWYFSDHYYSIKLVYPQQKFT